MQLMCKMILLEKYKKESLNNKKEEGKENE